MVPKCGSLDAGSLEYRSLHRNSEVAGAATKIAGRVKDDRAYTTRVPTPLVRFGFECSIGFGRCGELPLDWVISPRFPRLLDVVRQVSSHRRQPFAGQFATTNNRLEPIVVRVGHDYRAPTGSTPRLL